MSGATKDYTFGQKNNWRRAQWNQILSRTNGREKRLPILYLAGPNDNDRVVALSKGVPNQNLIAIDKDQRNVASVKSGGNPALLADAESVLRTWPNHRPVCALMLDFCSGLERRYFLDLREPLGRTPFAGAAISLNFQRGRDGSSSVEREQLQRGGFLKPLLKCPDSVRFLSEWSVDEKNRAAMFISQLCIDLIVGIFHGLNMDIKHPDKSYLALLYTNILSVFRPVFTSYQSGAVIFDSVVFTQIELPGGGGMQTDIEDQIDYNPNPQLARRISAMLAVRTGRMNA